jgi:hypothetical protein
MNGEIMSNKNQFSSEDEDFYKKALNLLNNKFEGDLIKNSEHALEELRSIFEELDKINPEETKKILNAVKFHSGILDFEVILNQASHENLSILFKEFCKLKKTTKKEFLQLEPLFDFVTGALLFSRKNENKKITWNDFLEYLNLDILIRSSVVRNDFPSKILNKLSKYLKNFPTIDFNRSKQLAEIYENHFILVTKLKSLFLFNNSEEILNNVNIMEVINNIMNLKANANNGNSIQNYVENILYDGNANEEQIDEINNSLSEFVSDEDLLVNNKVIYQLVSSVASKNYKKFIEATDQYIAHYIKNEKSKQTEPSKKLNIEDKVILFFSDHFEKFQMNTNLTYKRFIDLLVAYYDSEFFFKIMKHYQIPFNIPVREEMSFKTEDDQEITKQTYYNLLEIAVFSNKFDLADDLLQVENILEPFYARIIEDNTVYEYQSAPFTDLTYLDEIHFIYLIESGVMTYESKLPIFDEKSNQLVFTDLFYVFLNYGFDQAFVNLYEKSKLSNPKFSLKQFQQHIGLFSYYFIFLKESESDAVNGVILDVFRKEGYKLYEENADGFTPVDFIKDLPVELVVHTVAMLEDMFNIEQSAALTGSVLNKNKEISNILMPNAIDESISWFNRENLDLHFKKLSKSKEKEQSNLDYIKTMLSDSNHLRKNLLIDNENFFDDLLIKFPNFEEVIKFYKGQFRLKKLTGKTRIQPILLLGDPGVGKTYFAKEFAQLLNTGYTFIDMGSLTSNWILSGNNGSWKNAKQGKILEAIMKSKTVNPILLMDELDKARGGEWDPTMVLYQLLEEINAKEFTDEFIDFSFDASGLIYIACANSLNTIAPPLLSRFKVFNINKPNNSQITSVLYNIYNEAIKNTHIFNETLDDDVLAKLKKYSLRGAKAAIEDAISSVLLEIKLEDIDTKLKNNEKLSITVEHLKDPQKKNSIGFDRN